MQPIYASYLTGLILLLLICWADGLSMRKNWLSALFWLIIWPISLPIILGLLRLAMNKQRDRVNKDAGQK